jgi:hypothetical protein
VAAETAAPADEATRILEKPPPEEVPGALRLALSRHGVELLRTTAPPSLIVIAVDAASAFYFGVYGDRSRDARGGPLR